MAGQNFEFEIDGAHFRGNKLNALVQMNIASRLLTIIPHLAPIFKQAAALSATEAKGDKDIDLKAFAPFAEAVNALSDDQRNFIVGTCLATVFRQQGPGFLPIWDKANAQPVGDLDVIMMLRIVFEVLRANLGNFSPALASIFQSRPAGA